MEVAGHFQDFGTARRGSHVVAPTAQEPGRTLDRIRARVRHQDAPRRFHGWPRDGRASGSSTGKYRHVSLLAWNAARGTDFQSVREARTDWKSVLRPRPHP